MIVIKVGDNAKLGVSGLVVILTCRPEFNVLNLMCIS